MVFGLPSCPDGKLTALRLDMSQPQGLLDSYAAFCSSEQQPFSGGLAGPHMHGSPNLRRASLTQGKGQRGLCRGLRSPKVPSRNTKPVCSFGWFLCFFFGGIGMFTGGTVF